MGTSLAAVPVASASLPRVCETDMSNHWRWYWHRTLHSAHTQPQSNTRTQTHAHRTSQRCIHPSTQRWLSLTRIFPRTMPHLLLALLAVPLRRALNPGALCVCAETTVAVPPVATAPRTMAKGAAASAGMSVLVSLLVLSASPVLGQAPNDKCETAFELAEGAVIVDNTCADTEALAPVVLACEVSNSHGAFVLALPMSMAYVDG